MPLARAFGCASSSSTSSTGPPAAAPGASCTEGASCPTSPVPTSVVEGGQGELGDLGRPQGQLGEPAAVYLVLDHRPDSTHGRISDRFRNRLAGAGRIGLGLQIGGE